MVLLKERCTSCYRLRLSECLILFGIDDNIKTEKVFDFILLLAKQCLYKCKIEKQLANIDIFREKKKCYTDTKERNTMLRWAAHVQVSLPGGSLQTFLCRLIMLSSTSLFPVCSFIPCLWLMKCWLYQCRMSSGAPCIYVCNEDALKNVKTTTTTKTSNFIVFVTLFKAFSFIWFQEKHLQLIGEAQGQNRQFIGKYYFGPKSHLLVYLIEKAIQKVKW